MATHIPVLAMCARVSTGLDEADSHLRRPKSPQLNRYDAGRWRPCLSPDRDPEYSFEILFSPLHLFGCCNSLTAIGDLGRGGPWQGDRALIAQTGSFLAQRCMGM